jgi:hypothetical protein
MTLSDLEALAGAAKDAQAHVSCSPDVVLALVRVAKAARDAVTDGAVSNDHHPRAATDSSSCSACEMLGALDALAALEALP